MPQLLLKFFVYQIVETRKNMTLQTAITLSAASVGFCAAIFFCIGNAFNSPKQIINQASTYWDFNESLALALAAQRAQYVTGAMLLVISFCLQVVAIQASSSTSVGLPQWLQFWLYLVLLVFLTVMLLAGATSAFLYRKTKRKIKRHIQEIGIGATGS